MFRLVILLIALTFISISLPVYGVSIPTRHIRVDNVNRLHLADHSSIFDSIHYLSSNRRAAHHNVRIFDAFGKFIELTSFFQYEDHVAIFAVNPNTRDDIHYVECFTDERHTIHVKFKSARSAHKEYEMIRKHREHDAENRYFMTATTQWKCYNEKEDKYTPIVRRITGVALDITTDASLLIVTTQFASYTDLFQTLQLSLKSNGYHAMDMAAPVDPDTADDTSTNRRRLAWDYGSLWNNAVEGVSGLWRDVGGSIHGMKEYMREYASAHLKNASSTKHFVDTLLTGQYAQHMNATQSWSYNYNESSARARNIVPISTEIECVDCYAYADLTYAIDLEIASYKLVYLKMIATGAIQLNAEVRSRAAYHGEFSIRTPPELETAAPIQFDIAGIVPVTFSVFGEFAVGMDSEAPFWKTLSTKGEIVRGVEYNASRNEQRYITSRESFDRDVIGPVLESKANYAHLYQRITLYLKLALVGDVYLGTKSDSAVSVAEHKHAGCVIGYTPSATVTAFIGANISVSGWDIWHKTDRIDVYTLPAGESGCITRAEMTTLETWDFLDAMEQNTTVTTSAPDGDGDGLPPVYIDYTAPQTAYLSSRRWGKANTIWHANLSGLNGTCLLDAELPDSGFLMVYPVDNDGDILHGVYATSKHVTVEEGYVMTTDVNCVARYEFERMKNSDSPHLYQYASEMMDFGDVKCDVAPDRLKLEGLQVDDEWYRQFSLPSMMDAVVLDSSFNTILLHDLLNCFVFPLTKNTDLAAFTFDRSDVEMFANKSYQWPSRTWWGSFSCVEATCVNAVALYFTDVHWLSGRVNATFVMDNNETWSGSGQLYLDETLTLVMNVHRSDPDGGVFQTNGFITVLNDGSLIYSGVVPEQVAGKWNNEYMAFVFAGHLNMEQFESEANEEQLVRVVQREGGSTTGGISVLGWIAIVFASLSGLFSLIACIAYIQNGKNKKESQGSMYGVMDDRYL